MEHDGIATEPVRVGLAYLLAHNPEGYNPQIYGILYPQKIYLKGWKIGEASLIEK